MSTAPPSTPEPRRDAGFRAPTWLFWVLVVVLLPLMLTASLDFGFTWDEGRRNLSGHFALEYYRGLRPLEDAQNDTLYPAMFDVISVWLTEKLSVDPFVLRHCVNAAFGWIGILFSGLLARRLFGTWAGILSMVLLVTSPRYFAHSMNNPKDLPFAAMSMVALYCMARLSPRWPYITAGAGTLVAVGIALALNTRPGALLFFGYLLALVLSFVLRQRTTISHDTVAFRTRVDWKAAAELTARFGGVVVAALFLGTVFWPWAHASPFTRPFEALSEASNYPWTGTVLFRGEQYLARDLPSSYLSTWFLISPPPVVLAGMIMTILSRVRGWGNARLALWGAALIPIGIVWLLESPVYDGLRHALFAYPPMAILAASGWMGLLASRHGWVRAGAVVLLAAGLMNVMAFNVRSYPNQAAYVNELAGGPKAAFARYDLDYWGNCMLGATRWAVSVAERARMPVFVYGWPSHVLGGDTRRFPQVSVAAGPDDRRHLEIRLLRGRAEELRRMTERDDLLHLVTTHDGAPLCAVFAGPDYDELERRLRTLPPR